jgi:hypothetical protein
MIEKLLVLGVVAENGIGRNGNAFELSALVIVKHLWFLSQEVSNFDEQIRPFNGPVLGVSIGLVEVEGLLAELRRRWKITAEFLPQGQLFVG